MEVESGLLAAIYAAPADDAPRLVYGDWLLERADPRGELIALQYHRRSAPPDPGAQRREAELLEQNAASWLGELAPALQDATFERGFLSSAAVLACDAALESSANDPRWSTVEHLLVRHAYADAASTPAVGLLPRLGALQTVALSCETAEVVSEWANALAPIWQRFLTLDIDAPGLNVRLTRRSGERAGLWFRAELEQAWTLWAHRATDAMFRLLERLGTAGVRGVHVVDSRRHDSLTHRELRRLRRLLERFDGLDRVRLPKL